MGGERNDRRAQPFAFALAHLPGGFQAVHARHLHVHEHQIEGAPGKRGKRFLTAGAGHHVNAHLLQEHPRQFQVAGVIVHHQHPGVQRGAAAGRAGARRLRQAAQFQQAVAQPPAGGRFAQHPALFGVAAELAGQGVGVGGEHDHRLAGGVQQTLHQRRQP